MFPKLSSKDGVTLMVDTIGVVPVFVAVKVGTSPISLVILRPVEMLSFVQV